MAPIHCLHDYLLPSYKGKAKHLRVAMTSGCGNDLLLLYVTLFDWSGRVFIAIVLGANTKLCKYLFRHIEPEPSGGLV